MHSGVRCDGDPAKKRWRARPHSVRTLIIATLTLGACQGDPSPEPDASGGADGASSNTGGSSPSVGGSGDQMAGGGSDASTGGGEDGGEPGAGGNSDGGVGTGAMGPTVGGNGGVEGTGGEPSDVTCENQSPALSVTLLNTKSIAEMGVPFDSNSQDVVGPSSWDAQYGKSPEIVAVESDGGLNILFQDQESSDFAYVVRVSDSGAGYEVEAAYQVESLGRIMGIATDQQGNYFVATGVDEDDEVDADYPPNEIHRDDIVRIVKFDANGCVQMESDVDIERGQADLESEIIVNPMVAATSRLSWGGDRLSLVHGHNTEPDASLGGTRHQKSITTHLNALDGSVTRTSAMWASHSFDQRALYDGTGFVELHLGDAYPRALALARHSDATASDTHLIYNIKGEEGANNTFTRLGSVVQTTDPGYGYLALFSTERETDFDEEGIVQGTRDVALLRVASDFAAANANSSVVDVGEGTSEHSVMSSGETVMNHLRWMTDLGAGAHAERPRLAAVGTEQFALFYEGWSSGTGRDTFEGVFAMIVNAAGEIVLPAVELEGAPHISRGDDAVTLGQSAVYVSGNGDAKSLTLNLVNADLSFTQVELP